MQGWRAKMLHTVGKHGCLLKTLQKALAGLVSAGLLIYLTYALLRPERF